MKLLLGRYAFVYNRRHGRRGHLFSDRFWSRRIDRPHHLRCAAVYTALNSVAAGICAHPSEFAWSSYRETVGITPASGVLEPELLLRTLNEDVDIARVRYRELVDEAVARLARRRLDEAWWRTVDRTVPETPAAG